jgi:hypothetical protein
MNIIEKHQDVLRLQVPFFSEASQSVSASVHIGLWPSEQQRAISAEQRVALDTIEGFATSVCQLLDNSEAEVVSGTSIALAWIPQPDNESGPRARLVLR